MIIEKVRILKAIKAGQNVWDAGTILPKGDEPIPDVVLDEAIRHTGTVEILKQGQNVELVDNIPVLVQKEKLKEATTTTTVAEKKEKPKLKKKLKIKLKPKLVKRKK